MITWKNSVIPTYNLSKSEISISLYFKSDGSLIISGNVLGSEYIFCLSFTKKEDSERNEEIFNHIVNDEPERVSYMRKVLEYNKIPDSVLEEYYLVHLKRNCTGDVVWDIPFGHCYDKEQAESNGRFFADDVKNFLNEIHKRCDVRECSGRYEEILTSYVDFLQRQETYTSDVQKLEELLKLEEYLCVSPRKSVQEIYRKCCELCRELHKSL